MSYGPQMAGTHLLRVLATKYTSPSRAVDLDASGSDDGHLDGHAATKGPHATPKRDTHHKAAEKGTASGLLLPDLEATRGGTSVVSGTTMMMD